MSESKADQAPNPGEVRDMKVAALRYDQDADNAPVVVAAGAGYVAQKIVEIADACGITVYHDDSAATLLNELKLGQEIPGSLYQMVVDIYLAVIAAAQSTKEDLIQDTNPDDGGVDFL